jgi:hypothetical protein
MNLWWFIPNVVWQSKEFEGPLARGGVELIRVHRLLCVREDCTCQATSGMVRVRGTLCCNFS